MRVYRAGAHQRVRNDRRGDAGEIIQVLTEAAPTLRRWDRPDRSASLSSADPLLQCANLHLIAPQETQHLCLLLRLDAFRDDNQPQGVREGNDGPFG